ncbi:MAG: amidase family protein, partial [Flavobacteriaceae bacterium]
MKNIALFFLISVVFGCKNDSQKTENNLSDISEKSFRKFKVEDSNYIDLEELWAPFQDQLSSFSMEKYEALKPFIMNQDIPTLQRHIQNKILSYEALVTFYLYRINLLDRENKKSLNSVISLNSSIIEEARDKDKKRPKNLSVNSIYGMPILLKDNINAKGMVTTAGAAALMKNTTEDSFLSQQLKSSGALILGKANLSEWAYFFCGDCPSGYSAVGGQTFNPYGRKTLDTGGSSSGSAVAVAANFCAAAIGSETSGSILSPASQNAGVGLKPTIGTVSRSGI